MNPEPFRFPSFDGVEIAVHTLGEGRPTLMLHGFMASFERNWRAPGVADKVAASGRQVIAPDLRGHGASDAPTAPGYWPKDVLAMDQEALIKHLGLTDYDLVGYSLGARTAVRMMARGATPARCVLGGMGESGVLAAGARAAMFEDGVRHGEQAADPRSGRYIQAVMAQQGLKSDAMLGVLASFAATTVEALEGIAVPTLVISGDKDDDNGSAEDLAARLVDGRALRVPGDHLSAVGAPELAEAMIQFLSNADGAAKPA